jgi:hypothetical protein
MRNGGFWFKVKVLSFKIRLCNGDSDAQLTPTTAHAQTLGASAGLQPKRVMKCLTTVNLRLLCDK